MDTRIVSLQPETLAIVKLGGSIITQESGEIDLANLRSLGCEIAQYKFPLILVHGGGYLIKKILLDYKVKTDTFLKEQTPLVFHLRNSLVQLNTFLLNTFQEAGVHTVSIPAHSMFKSCNGKIIPSETIFEFLSTVIQSGKIPVLFGDVLDDKEGSFYFNSSDKIVSCLAKELKPKIVLFLTNVDGIYESFPPKSDKEAVFPVVTPNILYQLDNKYDVGHGEIYDKLVEAIECASHTNVCRIINGKVPGNLLDSLYGRLEAGTKVLPR